MVNNLNVYICVFLHAVVECIVCCLMTIQPLDFKSIKLYLILSYLILSTTTKIYIYMRVCVCVCVYTAQQR